MSTFEIEMRMKLVDGIIKINPPQYFFLTRCAIYDLLHLLPSQVQCSLCNHAWFQTRDRLFEIKDGFELVPFDQHQVDLIAGNLKAGRKAGYGGAAKLYVGNLAFGVEEADLVELFGKIGNVGEVIIVKNPETGRSRGFAFVTMMTKEDGEKAVSDLDGTDLMGRPLQVREPNNENAPRGSRD